MTSREVDACEREGSIYLLEFQQRERLEVGTVALSSALALAYPAALARLVGVKGFETCDTCVPNAFGVGTAALCSEGVVDWLLEKLRWRHPPFSPLRSYVARSLQKG
jgi:hypothetical protein